MIEKLSLTVLLAILPLQIGRHFWPFSSYVFGLKVDYLSLVVYLQDILIFFLLFVKRRRLWELIKGKRVFLILFFLGLIFVNLWVASSFFSALFFWLRIIELLLLGVVVKENSPLVLKILSKVIPLWVIGEFFIGLLQVVKQASLGGFFWWLGERTFNIFTPSIAKALLGGKVFLRPYGTFSHPNSLAGFILVCLILMFFKKQLSFLDKIGLVCGFCLLLLCFSRTVWLMVFALCLFYILSEMFFSFKSAKKSLFFSFKYYLSLTAVLLTVFLFSRTTFETSSFRNREKLANFAILMIKKSPFWGIGANNFIIKLSEAKDAWQWLPFLQPVHNIFLLTCSEVGLVGLIVFIIFLLLTVRRVLKFQISNFKFQIVIALMAIVFSGLFDHYWLTLIQNQLLFVVILGLAWSKQMVSYKHDIKNKGI